MALSITAVIPTRGDVDLGAVVENIRRHKEIREIILEIGDTVYNRYVAISRARYPVIYTQDDDCITDIGPLLKSYKPGVIVNAMMEQGARNYSEAETLVGYGAVFDAALVSVLDGWKRDELFKRECDRVFTSLNKHQTILPKIEILPCAREPNRMYKQPDHKQKVQQIRVRITEWKSKTKQ